MRTFLTVVVTASIIMGSLLISASRDARRYRSGGAPVRMYAADHYHPRPLVPGTRSRVNNNLNPHFQLGGGYGR